MDMHRLTTSGGTEFVWRQEVIATPNP